MSKKIIFTKKSHPIPPAPIHNPISNQQQSQSSNGFIGNMIQGFSLGVGSSIGHQLTERIFTNATPPPNNDCSNIELDLKNCMDCTHNDNDQCKRILAMLESCKKK
jgi:hypothetical protein